MEDGLGREGYLEAKPVNGISGGGLAGVFLDINCLIPPADQNSYSPPFSFSFSFFVSSHPIPYPLSPHTIPHAPNLPSHLTFRALFFVTEKARKANFAKNDELVNFFFHQ